MSKPKDTINSTFKTPLLNDCTNHIAFHLREGREKCQAQQQNKTSYFEAPIADVVTDEFIRGYN